MAGLFDDIPEANQKSGEGLFDDIPAGKAPAKKAAGFFARLLSGDVPTSDPMGTGAAEIMEAAAPVRTSVLEGMQFEPRPEGIDFRAANDRAMRPAAPRARGTSDARPSTPVDSGFVENAARILRKTVGGIEQGKSGLLRMAGDVTGLDSVSEFARDWNRSATELSNRTQAGKTTIDGFTPGSIVQDLPAAAEGAAVSIAQQLPALATGNVPAALAIMMGQSTGQQFNEVRDKGLDLAPAIVNAVLTGGAEVVGEKFGGTPGTIKALKGALAGNAPARVAADMARAGARDIPGELGTTLMQYGTDAAPVIGTNADASISELGAQLKNTALQTVLQGGMMSGGGAAVATAARAAGAQPGPVQASAAGPTPLLPAPADAATTETPPARKAGIIDRWVAGRQAAGEIDRAAQEIADQPAPQVAQQTVASMFADLPDAQAARQPAAPAPAATEVGENQPAALDTRAPSAIDSIAPEKAIDTTATVAPEVKQRLVSEGWTPPEAAQKEAPALSTPAPAATETIATGTQDVQNPAPQSKPEAQAAAAPAPQAGADPFTDIPAAPAAGAAPAQAAGVNAAEAQSQPTPAAIENVAPQRLGRNNTPLAEGGKPFKTKLQADTARKGQTMMRVIKVEGGYALADKTPAQLAAQEKASRRLRSPQTSPPGQAIPAHAMIAAAGGLHPDTRSDMGMQGNVSVGNRKLFGGTGKGLTIERATEKLIEDGYLPEGAGHDQARELLKRSLTNPQYTAEGAERMAQAEADTRFEDHLAAQQEAAAEDPDFDPFPAGDGWLEADLQEAGYDVASPEIQAEVRALIDLADAAGIDSESLMLDAHDATRDGTTQEYYEQAKAALEKAIARGDENSSEDAGQPGSAREQEPAGPAAAAEPGPADDGGLTDYTPKEVTDRLDKLEQAEKDRQAADTKADAEAKKERERKDIASRQDASAENFELGQDPNDSLSGQQGMFSRPAAASAKDQTETPAFKKWFGTSKVVDAAGKPLVVYRGEHGATDDGDLQTALGTFTFAESPAVASTYASAPNDYRMGDTAKQARVIPAYLSIKNPVIENRDDPFVDLSDIAKKLSPAFAKHMALKHAGHIENTGNWEEIGASSVKSFLHFEPDGLSRLYMDAYPLLDDPEFVEFAKDQGYDGAIHIGNGESAAELEYRVFEKNQIKSAIGNNGDFDGSNTDVRRSLGAAPSASTATAVRAALSARFGPLVANMEKRGFLQLWDSAEQFNESGQRSEKIEGVAQGLWDGKTAHLFADGIRPGDEVAVMLHEVGEHASMQQMLGPKQYNRLVARAHDLMYADDAVALEAVARIPENTPEKFRDSELLAYMIEIVASQEAKASPTARKWLADVVAAIRAWWSQTPMAKKLLDYGIRMELTPKDIAALAVRAVKWRGTQGVQDVDIQLSRPAPAAAPAPGGRARPMPASSSWTAPPGSPPVNPRTGAVTPQPWNVAEPGTMDNFVRAIQNNKIDLKRVREAIAAQGAIPAQADAYLSEELYHGKVSARVTALHEQQVEPILKKIAVAGQNSGITLDDVNQYLHARHAPERNAAMQAINPGMANNTALSGMSDADAAQIMKDFAAAGKTAGLANIAADVDQLLRDTRTGMVADGLEDASTVQAWEQAYQHYAPLQRDIKTSGTPKGQGISVRGPEAKRAVGSNKEVVNILANIVAQAETAAIRAEKAIVGRALLDMARQYPNPAFWKVDAAPTKPRIDKDTGLVIRNAIDPMFQTADNVVMVKDYGIEHFIVFETKSERAMAVAKAMKNLEVAPMNKILEVASKGTRFIASLLTQRNPLFWMTNFARDIQGALINLQGTDAEGLQDKVLANLPKAFKGMHALVRGTGTGQWARYASEIQEAGGTTGYMQQFENSDARMDDLKKIVAQMQQGKADPRRLARVALEFVDDYNDIIENAVRLSVFQAARDNGVSTAKAASIAKNITVNFNRKGNLTPPINALYMFFNASVQGTARLAQALATSRSAQVVVGGIAVMGFLLDALNRAMSDDDEETGRNRYDMIPEFEKSKNWIFMNPMRPGEYVKVPLPLGPHVFHNAGRFISDAVFRKNPRNASEYGWSMASTVLDAFSPLGTTPSVGQLIAPSILDPVVQLAENKSFTGGPVYRSDDMGFGKTDPKPAYTRHFESTPDIWKAASRGLNDLSGGDKDKPGKLNVEPDILKHVFYAMTGGPGRMLDQTTDAVQGQARGEKPSVNRVPFVSRFYGENDDRQRERVYYDDRKRAMDTKTRFDHFSKIGRPDLAREVAEELGDGDLAKGRRLMREHASTQSSVRKLNKQIRAEQQKQQDGTDRSEQLRALKQRRVKVMGSAGRDPDDE